MSTNRRVSVTRTSSGRQVVRTTTSRRGMPAGGYLGWWLLIICTGGLAWPFYAARMYRAKHTTVSVTDVEGF